MGKAGMWKIAFVLRAREWPLGVSVGAKISRLEGNGRAAAVQKRGTFFPEFMCLLLHPAL